MFICQTKKTGQDEKENRLEIRYAAPCLQMCKTMSYRRFAKSYIVLLFIQIGRTTYKRTRTIIITVCCTHNGNNNESRSRLLDVLQSDTACYYTYPRADTIYHIVLFINMLLLLLLLISYVPVTL